MTHEQASPQAIGFLVTPPILPQHSVAPLHLRHSPSARHGSISFTSEHHPLEVAAGYEADLDNSDRESHRTTTHSSQPASQPLPTTANTPSSPPRRPSGPRAIAPRPSSPLLQSPAKPSTRPLPQRPERLRYQTSDATFNDKYGHLILTPPPPPLSPYRPSFSNNDDSGENLAQILKDTSDNSAYKSLLRLEGDRAQTMLNFLQKVRHVTAQKSALSPTSLPPSCLIVQS